MSQPEGQKPEKEVSSTGPAKKLMVPEGDAQVLPKEIQPQQTMSNQEKEKLETTCIIGEEMKKKLLDVACSLLFLAKSSYATDEEGLAFELQFATEDLAAKLTQFQKFCFVVHCFFFFILFTIFWK